MRKAIYVLVLALIVTLLAVSCNADPAPLEETVSITFSNSGRDITSELERFYTGEYYWKYAAEKADDSNLNSGATESYSEEGARFIHENETGLEGNLSGFSQGWWNFKLFAYKKINSEYVLIYQGEAKNQLLKNSGVNRVTVTVNPINAGSTKTGILFIDYDNLHFIPAQSGVTEGDLVGFEKKAIVKALGSETECEPSESDNSRYSLTPGSYDITLYFEKSGIIYSAESVVTTVYQGLETKLSGNLKESLTHFTFDSNLNPDIITAKVTSNSVSSSSIPTEGLILNQNDSKVSAAIPNSVATSYIERIIAANSASGATADNTTMTMSVNVQTTEASNSSLTFEIGMSANITITNGETVHTISDSVSTLSDYVTTVVKIQSGLDNVVVTHKGETMSSDLGAPNEYGAYSYDKVSGDLTIKTKSFSPFSVTYKVKLGYDITFDYSNGSEPVTFRVDYWQDIYSLDDLEDPMNGSMFFKGWYDGEKEFSPWRTFTGDMTLTAKWVDGVKVTINSVYGNEERICEKGGYLNYWPTSPDPTLQFDCYTLENGETWYNTVLESDITLKANFKAKELYIYYYDLDYKYIDSQKYSYNDVTYEPSVPERDGMEFIGWFRNKDGEHLPENKYVFGNPLTESINLFAVYNVPPHTVTYMNVEGLRWSSDPITEQVYDGNLAREYGWCNSMPSYYQLDYWKTEDGNKFVFNTPIRSNITLYPVLKYQEGKEIDAICRNGFLKGENYYDDIQYSGTTNIKVSNAFAGGFIGSVTLGYENPSDKVQSFFINMDLVNGDTNYKLTDGNLNMTLVDSSDTETSSNSYGLVSGSIKAQIGNLFPESTLITCDNIAINQVMKREVEYVDGGSNVWAPYSLITIDGSLHIGDCKITADKLSITMTRESSSSAPVFSLKGSVTIAKSDKTSEVYSITGENGITVNMTDSGFSISGSFTKTVGENIETFMIGKCDIGMGENGYNLDCHISRTIGDGKPDVYIIKASLGADQNTGEFKFTFQLFKNGVDITDKISTDSLLKRILGEVQNILTLMPIVIGYGDTEGVEFEYIRTNTYEKDGFGEISITKKTKDKDTTWYHVIWNIDKYTDFVGEDHSITGEWEFTTSYCETENATGDKINEDSFVYTSPLTVDCVEYSEEFVLGNYFFDSIINGYTWIH